MRGGLARTELHHDDRDGQRGFFRAPEVVRADDRFRVAIGVSPAIASATKDCSGFAGAQECSATNAIAGASKFEAVGRRRGRRNESPAYGESRAGDATGDNLRR
jgi:hypothetical protein